MSPSFSLHLQATVDALHKGLNKHVKAIVGSGISVYTAFMAFGFVRLNPGNALNPKMWAIPLAVGLVIIIYHQVRIRMAFYRPRQATAGVNSAGAEA